MPLFNTGVMYSTEILKNEALILPIPLAMSAELVIVSFTNDYKSLIATLQRIEANAASEIKNRSLSYESVREWPLNKLAQLSERDSVYKHRVKSQLFEFAGSLQSLLTSRNHLAGAETLVNIEQCSVQTPASRECALTIAANLEVMVNAVPITTCWVPIAACNEVISQIRS